ncbi:hypothetical protein GGR28_003767 [Lewinella aquimaris]|uniref:Thoeris protein ThsB TIR-like domain-containing protein n=2 Tax=Neolewinella aquimaris TaxID=1835722 RepID=A0A840E7W1_9BACT|nr:hypothetical protein [Neolewinella aquimaris]
MVDKSLSSPINSYNEEYIMQVIRRDYLSDSTVTLFLIGNNSAENLGWNEQRYIKRELQASLYHGAGNTKNGILGIVLPDMHASVFAGAYYCSDCGASHSTVIVDDTTVVSEFSYNYYIPNNKCAWYEEDKYCVLVSWDNFIRNPQIYIEQAFAKRTSPIANKTKVRP